MIFMMILIELIEMKDINLDIVFIFNWLYISYLIKDVISL